MGYTEHLQRLLQPLGVYALSPESLSGGELAALGAGFDALYDRIQDDLRESLPITATGSGLTAYESLLGIPRVTQDVPTRRNGVLGLLRLQSSGATVAALRDAAAFTGAELSFDESDCPQSLEITLEYDALPQNTAAIEAYLTGLLPAHLNLHFTHQTRQ